jgi:hypothetical protein
VPSVTPPTTTCTSCNTSGCTFPWDGEASGLGSDSTIADVVAVLQKYNAFDSAYQGVFAFGGLRTQDVAAFANNGVTPQQSAALGVPWQNASDVTWQAVVDVYEMGVHDNVVQQSTLAAEGGRLQNFSEIVQTTGHNFIGRDVFENGGAYNRANIGNWAKQPGSGQAFLKWFDQSNCGSPMLIMDNIN